MFEFLEEISIDGIVARKTCEQFMNIPREKREYVYHNLCNELEKTEPKLVKLLKKYHEKHILFITTKCLNRSTSTTKGNVQ